LLHWNTRKAALTASADAARHLRGVRAATYSYLDITAKCFQAADAIQAVGAIESNGDQQAVVSRPIAYAGARRSEDPICGTRSLQA